MKSLSTSQTDFVVAMAILAASGKDEKVAGHDMLLVSLANLFSANTSFRGGGWMGAGKPDF